MLGLGQILNSIFLSVMLIGIATYYTCRVINWQIPLIKPPTRVHLDLPFTKIKKYELLLFFSHIRFFTKREDFIDISMESSRYIREYATHVHNVKTEDAWTRMRLEIESLVNIITTM